MPMKRMLFHIPNDLSEQLTALAKQNGISLSELVRRFIVEGLMRWGKEDRLAEMQREIDALQRYMQAMDRRLEDYREER